MAKTNYNDLLSEIVDLDMEEKRRFFEDFFVYDNYKNYKLDKDINEKEKHAIANLFTSGGELVDRVMESLSIDENCKEALLIYNYSFDDVLVYQKFLELYERLDDFEELSDYSKRNYICAMEAFADFLASIQNISSSIKYLKIAINLKEEKEYRDYVRLAALYAVIEDSENLLKLVDEVKMEDCFIYLITIITLLKHEDSRATEVFQDMLNDFEESDYIDHMWDMDLKNKKHATFVENVDGCFDMICAIPDFFSWCSNHKSVSKLS